MSLSVLPPLLRGFISILALLILAGCRREGTIPPSGTSPVATVAAVNPDITGDPFFTNYPIPRISITITGTNLDLLRRESRTYVLATFSEGTNSWNDVAVHLKGTESGSFRPLDDKPALTVNFDKFQKKQHYHGLDKFYLNNSVEDEYFMNEHLCGQLFREAGVPAPRVTHARVQLNGKDRGLYVLKEGFDKRFLRGWFTNVTGNLYDGGLVFDVDENLRKTSGDDSTDQADLKALAAAAREPDLARRWERLQQLLDMPRFISFVAMEILTSHTDGYSLNKNNYRIYHDPASGKMVFMPHGMDIIFTTPDLQIEPAMDGLVARAVMDIPQGRALYRQRISELATNIFRLDIINRRIDQLHARIRPLRQEISEQLAQDFDTGVEGLRLVIAQRIRSVQRQLSGTSAPVARFDSEGVLALNAWRAENDFGNHRLDQVSDQNRSTLHIQAAADAPCTASWRTNVVLAAGRYRFSGQARCAGVVALKDSKGEGAGLRISGLDQPRQNQLSGELPWTPLAFDFELTPEADGSEIELICELRATKGEVWFDLATLKLTRL